MLLCVIVTSLNVEYRLFQIICTKSVPTVQFKKETYLFVLLNESYYSELLRLNLYKKLG